MREGAKDNQAKPLLRWAGSKAKVVDKLVRRVPPRFNRYIEPFAGSACLFFKLKPEIALLADFNADLINTYSAVQRSPQAVFRYLAEFGNSPEDYYRCRDLFNQRRAGNYRQAARFLYLNCNCFNAVYRTNRNGEFNVPKGTKARSLPSLNQLSDFQKRFAGATFAAQDYRETVRAARRGDFVYLDPPYRVGVRNRLEYGVGSFEESCVPELLKEIQRLDNRGVHFLLSYSSNADAWPEIERYNLHSYEIRRSVAGFQSARQSVKEVLISNY